jgi:hypothetical protein
VAESAEPKDPRLARIVRGSDFLTAGLVVRGVAAALFGLGVVVFALWGNWGDALIVAVGTAWFTIATVPLYRRRSRLRS